MLGRCLAFCRYGTTLILPSPDSGGPVVDFSDVKFLNSLVNLWKKSLHTKKVNPEFAFYQRAEMGLYNLLHLLRAKVDTSAVAAKADKFQAPSSAYRAPA
jgi:hypothetical protein